MRREPGLDVLLITVDTLRADALGSYGRPDAGTPWMDRLAAAGVRFADAHAHNVVTLPSHANLLSGLLPTEHGVRTNAGFRFPADVETLATVLRREGYRTGAFVSAFPLDARFGLARGFDVYEDSFVEATSRPAFLEQERPGVETVALARAWLDGAGVGDADEADRPAFAWVHLYEPHFPWTPPEPFASRFADHPYQGDVAAADAALAPLLEPLLAAGPAGDTLVVLTSDHGEALGEHGEATHGIFAYEEVLRVPLLLFQPRLFAPRVVDAAARHVDLLPTVLDALGIVPPPGLSGRSLLPLAAGGELRAPAAPADPDAAADVYFEALSGQLDRGWAPLHGLIQGREKLVDLPIVELYDLATDPEEETNLAADRPERVAALRERLARFRADDPGPAPTPEEAAVRERLRSLGYLGGGSAGPPTGPWTADDDPKRLIELDAALRDVAGLAAAGRFEEALRLCRSVVRRRPGMRLALIELAHLERETGDLERSIATLREAFALDPGDPVVLALLATDLVRAGRPGEAVDLTGPHAGLAEPDVEVLLVRSLALARIGRGDEALAEVRRAEALDPTSGRVAVHRGTLLLLAGRRDEAARAFEEALERVPGMVRAHTALGVLAAEEGRTEDAVAHWRAAVTADPDELPKLLGFAGQLRGAGREETSRALLALFAATAPEAEYGDELPRVRALLAEPG